MFVLLSLQQICCLSIGARLARFKCTCLRCVSCVFSRSPVILFDRKQAFHEHCSEKHVTGNHRPRCMTQPATQHTRIQWEPRACPSPGLTHWWGP